MQAIYNTITTAYQTRKRLFTVLIDPEKCVGTALEQVIETANKAQPDFIFVGGSQLQSSVEETVVRIKKQTTIPVILFPGNALQLTNKADAILLISLISGRNAEWLIGQHVLAAKAIQKSGLETISTGYILIDGGNRSAVERVSKTKPLQRDAIDEVVSTALAGQLLGHKLIYLEAGSGAQNPVPTALIKAVKKAIDIPLIVGGGLTSTNAIKQAYEAGADIVVVGNYLETHLEKMVDFCATRN
ncbi:MAG TPA: geranylgeranylglyceryl/heptaprenylglyceryl phosphate synthase [Paludibacteraceae bacterium]|nr:geranylgeranylglyceryl/heptaprenylglyceryl phosphate synthase [Paludibacteraceae bacterium]